MRPARLAGSASMNKAIYLTFLTIVCVFVPAGTTNAQSIEEARTLYTEGRFTEAAELAQSLDTLEGYALAANSLAIYSYYMAPDGEKEGSFRRAVELAQKAILLDNSNPEAYLQLAHAMGRLAQVTGTWEALNEGYAGQVRDAIQEALRLAPDMAAAHLSLAAWHAGVVGAAGFMAGLLYDANEEDALAHFERALELAPPTALNPTTCSNAQSHYPRKTPTTGFYTRRRSSNWLPYWVFRESPVWGFRLIASHVGSL